MPEAGSDIRGVIELLWSRKWLILAVTLLGGLIAAAFASRQTPTYDSEAKVLVQPVVLSPTDPTQTIQANMDTEAELADSVPAAELVIKELKLDEAPTDLLADLDVKVALDTEILSFTYQAGEATVAQERTQAFAEAYLTYRRLQVSNEALRRRRALQLQGRALEQQLTTVTAKIAATQAPAQVQVLEQRATNLVNLLTANQSAVLSFPDQLAVGAIVQPATPPGTPSGPSDILIVVLGVVLGAALGTIMALLGERIADRTRSAPELEAKLAAPVLALVPKRRRRLGDSKRSAVDLWNDANSSRAEAFRVLRTNLLASPVMEGSQTLLVTSAQPGEGKTMVAAHLGIALALSGHGVVVVDAALRHPTLHKLLRCEASPGLTGVLTKGLDPKEVVRRSDLENFQFLSSGEAVDRPVELLGSEEMQELLRSLEGSAEFVVIDGGPVLGVADGLTVAPFADGILVVVDPDVSEGRTIQQARRLLDLLHVPVVGAVLNRYSPSEARRSYGGESYGDPETEAGRTSLRSATTPRSAADRQS